MISWSAIGLNISTSSRDTFNGVSTNCLSGQTLGHWFDPNCITGVLYTAPLEAPTCWVPFKTMHFGCALELLEHYHPGVYALSKRTSSLPVSSKVIYTILSEVILYLPESSIHGAVFNSRFKTSFDRKPNQIPPLGIRIQPQPSAAGYWLGRFGQRDTLQYSIPSTPSWLLHRPQINYSLHSLHKDDTAPEIFRHNFNELCAVGLLCRL